ncbi:MAG: hypothetical protein NXH82_10375 [Rhodobacteraceae bacterium]|nr:hypothetical protein [Paracoccaceae bacterium]
MNYKTLNAQIKRNREIPIRTVDQLSRVLNVPLSYFSDYSAAMTIQSDEGRSILHQRASQAYTEALRSEQMAMMRAGFEVGTDEVLDWLATQNNRLHNFDALSDRVDLFFPVAGTDRIMRPYRLGRNSLATRHFQIESEDHFMRTVEKFDPALIDRVVASHAEMERVPYKVSDEAIDVWIGSAHIQHRYRRVMAPVTDQNGNRYTLVHAKLI